MILEKLQHQHPVGAAAYRPKYRDQPGTDAGDDVLALMERCWCERAADRPSFSDVTKQLIKINNRRCVCVCVWSNR